LRDLIQREPVLIYDYMGEREELRLEARSDLRPAACAWDHRRHLSVGKVRVEPGRWSICEREPWTEAEGPCRRIILVHRSTLASRRRKIVVEVTITACSFDHVQHAVGNRRVCTIKVRVNRNRRRGVCCWRVGRMRQRTNRKRALIVVLMSVEDHVHAV